MTTAKSSTRTERAALMAAQYRLAARLNDYSQRSGYAVGHTDRPEYQGMLAEARANSARIAEIDAAEETAR